MSTRLVWAHTPLRELDGATGFVECEESVAFALLEAGKVQDPRIGARAMEPAAPPFVAPPLPGKAQPADEGSAEAVAAGARVKTKPRGTITKGEGG